MRWKDGEKSRNRDRASGMLGNVKPYKKEVCNFQRFSMKLTRCEKINFYQNSLVYTKI